MEISLDLSITGSGGFGADLGGRSLSPRVWSGCPEILNL
uniref:Uncharacterized protein n=1 Tax=Arundo donax TaxID=35708 RepID=A0A0A9EVL9_ARUDO